MGNLEEKDIIMSEDMNRSTGTEEVEKNQSTMEESIERQLTTNGPSKHIATLGHVRSRHQDTNEIILIPTPSSDPNDPLNCEHRTVCNKKQVMN